MPRSRPARVGISPVSRATWAACTAGHGKAVLDAAPPAATPRPDPDTDWAPWLREGAEALIEALASVDPDAPTWHPFPVATVARVWPRRQAQETAVHRWDAEAAVGTPSPIDAELGERRDRRVLRDRRCLVSVCASTSSCRPEASTCTAPMSPASGSSSATATGCRVVREHAKGDAALRGPAEAILLRLWNRTSPRADELNEVGDPAVAAAWLSLPGM